MNIDFGFLKPNRIIIDRPIEELGGRDGNFKSLPTPGTVEGKPFNIFGDSTFDMNLKRNLPSRSLSTVNDCLVHGQSAALFTMSKSGRATHWAVLPELALDKNPENYSRFFQRHADGWTFPENRKLRATRRVKNAILIGSRYSFNYFHFVCDSLIRALIADDIEDLERWPLVITPSVPQIAEIARMLCPGREIIEMKADDLIYFEKLSVPVSSSYSPDDPTHSSEAVMDVPYLSELRARLTKPFESPPHDDKTVIFAKRPFYQTESGAISRTILNQDEVVSCVEDEGGIVISPEVMTIQAQRDLFSRADIVIAMAGSALANAVFCRPGATIIMICQNKIVQPAYFAMMFDALGLNFIVVASEPVEGTSPHPSHLSVIVDIATLQRAITHGKRS